jgi:NADH:ubiquinone oxidoreductase subunit D
MRESINIVKLCLANLPEGPVKIDNYKIQSTPKIINENTNGKLNSIILNIYSEGFHIPKSFSLYSLLKLLKRETGVFHINNGS